MLLRDFLNEFELDWAQAPVRSGLIPAEKLKNANVLICGGTTGLRKAAAWSFLAWNDAKKTGIRVAELEDFSENGKAVSDSGESFSVSEADYIILTGLCAEEVPGSAAECLAYLKKFRELVQAACAGGCRRVLLLSDGRVYGRLPKEFAASEYEAGRTDPSRLEYSAQYLLQAMESMLMTEARLAGKAYQILRTGLVYGPCIPMLPHMAAELAQKTAASEEIRLHLTPARSSYICIHDVLTALQFVLTVCPDNKILNAKGAGSDQSAAELAVLLYRNFPEQCRLELTSEQPSGNEDEGVLLNTQLLEHYGFRPSVNMEDGLIILVKCLQNTGEVFIFDNTYYGKLDRVQKILLGYLLEIDRICRKHNIKYFLAGGTLLGAIRHHGFIPWDDDADVMMLREDYDKFLKVAPQELPEHIFIQLPETEKGNYNPFTKLRINNTMFATEFTGHFMDMHNGIFFDILSHDQTGNHKWSQKLHLMATMLTRSIVFNKWGDTDIAGGGAHPIICKIVDRLKYLIPMPLALWAQNCSLRFFQNRKSSYLYDGMGRNLKRGAFPKEWLKEAVYVDFEGCQFPVPKEYDKYLTYLYGDYMQMIPVSERRTSHSIVLMDLGAYGDYHL